MGFAALLLNSDPLTVNNDGEIPSNFSKMIVGGLFASGTAVPVEGENDGDFLGRASGIWYVQLIAAVVAAYEEVACAH